MDRPQKIPKVSATPARIALGVLAAALLTPFFVINHYAQSQLNQLTGSPVKTIGRVTGKQCNNHGMVFYAYVVENREFRGYGSCRWSCTELGIGDSVDVVYARQNPSNSVCGNVQDERGTSGNNFYMLGLLAAVLAVVIFNITRVDNIREP